MTGRSVTHSTFTLEGTCDASPARAFAAFADPYLDIVENQRIVHAYDMLLDEERSSVSPATIELEPAGDYLGPARAR